jgi:hypothetical protein
MVTLFVLVIILFLFIFLLVRKGQRLTAAEVVSNYLNTTLSGRTAEAYQFLSSRDKDRESLPAYQARRSLGHGLIANMIARKINYTVQDAAASGSRATVTVVITGPDFKRMMTEILTEMTGDDFPDQPLESFIFVCRNITQFLAKYRGAATPLQTSSETFRLILEKDVWKICLEE